MAATMNSVIQKACHTPAAPTILLSTKAMGIITTIYRNKDMISDGNPFPRPSRAPEEQIETAETINPILIILKASEPASIVCGFAENIAISLFGIIKQSRVPTVIIDALKIKETL